MKFFTIETSKGIFTLNINDIKSLNKHKAQTYKMFGGPHHNDDIRYYPENYSVDVDNEHYEISKKEYLQIMKMIVDNE